MQRGCQQESMRSGLSIDRTGLGDDRAQEDYEERHCEDGLGHLHGSTMARLTSRVKEYSRKSKWRFLDVRRQASSSRHSRDAACILLSYIQIKVRYSTDSEAQLKHLRGTSLD